jgi:hypothetical protein
MMQLMSARKMMSCALECIKNNILFNIFIRHIQAFTFSIFREISIFRENKLEL